MIIVLKKHETNGCNKKRNKRHTQIHELRADKVSNLNAYVLDKTEKTKEIKENIWYMLIIVFHDVKKVHSFN